MQLYTLASILVCACITAQAAPFIDSTAVSEPRTISDKNDVGFSGSIDALGKHATIFIAVGK